MPEEFYLADLTRSCNCFCSGKVSYYFSSKITQIYCNTLYSEVVMIVFFLSPSVSPVCNVSTDRQAELFSIPDLHLNHQPIKCTPTVNWPIMASKSPVTADPKSPAQTSRLSSSRELLATRVQRALVLGAMEPKPARSLLATLGRRLSANRQAASEGC